MDVINIQFSGEQDTEETDKYHDMFTFCDGDPKKACILVDVVKFWPAYWAPHCMLENFTEPLSKPDMKWSAASQKKTNTGVIMEWLKQSNLFADDFKIMEKHFRSRKDLLVANRWAIVLNVVGGRYFKNPMICFSRFPRQPILQKNNEPEPEETESPQMQKTKGQQLGAASGISLNLLNQEEVVVPQKRKRKAKAVKEFEVTWETKLERANMSDSHVSQAFALMNTKRITSAEGISVSAKNCIQPALERLARPLDKQHVNELVRLYKKEQKQGDWWLVPEQIRLICLFVVSCIC